MCTNHDIAHDIARSIAQEAIGKGRDVRSQHVYVEAWEAINRVLTNSIDARQLAAIIQGEIEVSANNMKLTTEDRPR